MSAVSGFTILVGECRFSNELFLPWSKAACEPEGDWASFLVYG